MTITLQHDISDAVLGEYIKDLLGRGKVVLVKDGRKPTKRADSGE